MKEPAKLAALLLCIVLLLQTVACAGESKDVKAGNETETTATEETTNSMLSPSLPDKNWDGREFRSLAYKHSTYSQFDTFEIYAESETGEVVNDAVFRRNRFVEGKYNVKITQVLEDNNDEGTMANIRRVVATQEDLYDIAFSYIQQIGILAREGLFYDLNKVNYIDFSQDYWNPEVNAAMSFKNRLFFTSSDFSLRDKSRAYILIYNRNLAKDHAIGNIADLVRAGTWTIDKMAEYSKSVAADANANGAVDDEDVFGTVMDSYNAFITLMIACGNVSMTKTSEDIYELSLNNEHTISSIDKVLNLTGQPNEAIFCDDWKGKVDYDHWGVSGRVFMAGRALFTIAFPHSLKSYSADCEFEYGIIPFPKYDETQKNHYTFADIFCMLFAIPITNQETDFAGFMLEALSAAATTTSLQAYYEISCKTKYTYDQESAEMLDLIFSNIVYEPMIVYNIGDMRSMYYKLAEKKDNVFSSLYASVEKRALADIDKLVDDFDSIP